MRTYNKPCIVFYGGDYIFGRYIASFIGFYNGKIAQTVNGTQNAVMLHFRDNTMTAL